MMSIYKHIIIFLILFVCLGIPASAGMQYTTGTPEFLVYLSGPNEFSPGDDIQLNVVIENHGLNEYKYVQSNLVTPDDLPNTAKHLSVMVSAGDAPVTIKSDPQTVGDLAGGSSVTAVFTAKINADARGGTYLLPVELSYSTLSNTDKLSADTVRNYYVNDSQIITIPITIKPDISLNVISAVPEHLNAGSEGYINMTVKNIGSEAGKKAIIKITQNDDSPIVPTDSSVYIGDFPAGGVVNCLYKVAVSQKAERQTYPVDVMVSYENLEGDDVNSRSVTIGIPVGSKVNFEIVSPPVSMNPGNTQILSIVYKNTGDTPVVSAQARISAVDPFTSSNDVAYLGDLNPGESTTATYEISVSRSATLKEYGLDSEIRYRDALDNTYISDPMKVNINVENQGGIAGILSNPVYLTVIIAAIIGLIYIGIHYRKKQV
ncbi:MAG: S-layer protein [Methanoregula sp.]